MNDRELAAALEPVKNYFRGSGLSNNTVLAAYLRSKGLPASGDAWQLAKAGLSAGMSFDEAADLAFAQLSSDGDDEPLPVPDSITEVEFAELVAAESEVIGTEEDSFTDQQAAASGALPHALTWYAKPMGMGDLHGEGATKLLGQPNIPLASMLVRETAQNSWDARLRSHAVDFTINLRRLDAEALQTIRRSIFTGAANGLGVHDALSADDVWVIEISDRGTRGLDGPIRNDLAVPEGTATNFIDLIFNVGAPRDVHMGAGTYGFGKTVSYLASACHTVLFWSRTKHRGALQDRLIGSAIGPSFDADGQRYTGRHWWGVASPDGDDDRVEPLVGEPARTLGEQVFQRHFRDDETGTSLMILAPDLGEEGSHEDWARALAQAAMWHLWPKMVPQESLTFPMRIQVQCNGVPVVVPDVDQDPLLRGYADALRAVRAVQEGGEYSGKFHTTVHEVWSQRPQTLLGHLALTLYPDRGAAAPVTNEIAPVEAPSHHLALMRHEAELVVKYDPRPQLDFEGIQWAGVFKPTARVDDSFAAAEPPAHDDWAYAAVKDRVMRSHVRVAQTRLRELVTEFLKPSKPSDSGHRTQHTTAALGDALADLIPSVEGARPTRRRPKGGGSTGGGKRPQISILEHRLGPLVDGMRRIAVRVEVHEPTGGLLLVEPDVGIALDGGRDEGADAVRPLGWASALPELGALEAGDEHATLEDGSTAWFAVAVQPDLALDVRFKLTGVEA